MAKRRTRKDKVSAKHPAQVVWDPASTTLKFEPGVNRQIKNDEKFGKPQSVKHSQPVNSAQMIGLIEIRSDIIKSLAYSALILGFEIVLYFFWN